MRCLAAVVLLLLAGCSFESSSLGVACSEHGHCDSGFFCGDGGACVEGPAPADDDDTSDDDDTPDDDDSTPEDDDDSTPDDDDATVDDDDSGDDDDATADDDDDTPDDDDATPDDDDAADDDDDDAADDDDATPDDDDTTADDDDATPDDDDTTADDDDATPDDDDATPDDDDATADDDDATADPNCGQVITSAGIDLVYVCAGSFTMGCLPGRDDTVSSCAGDGVDHVVELTAPFLISQTEITAARFAALTGYDPSIASACTVDCPVGNISWHEAAALANEASSAAALPYCYTCTGLQATTECVPAGDPYACGGFRLPTEAEWEYAARGGESHTFAGSDDPAEVAWYSDNASGRQPVAGLQANGFGLYDMSGNHAEWVEDWWDASYYASSPPQNPAGPATGFDRSVRGGGVFFADSLVRSGARFAGDPDDRVMYFGARLVRPAP